MNKGIPFPISSCTTHKWPWKSLKAVSHTDQVNSNSMGTKLAGLAYPEQRAPWPGGGHWEALTHSIQCRITWFLKGNVKSKRFTNSKKQNKKKKSPLVLLITFLITELIFVILTCVVQHSSH